MARVLLIVNTNATRHSDRRQRAVQLALEAHHKLEVAATTHRGHATFLAQEAVTEGFDSVITLGGDGTINEAIQGLAGTGVTLGVLPGGNTNVLARSLGISRKLEIAVGQLLRGLELRRTRSLGLGAINGRWFAFVAGLGFDAQVVWRVEQRVRMKHVYGDWFFASAAIATFFRGYDREVPAISLETAERMEPGVFWALVLNSSPYTYLKGRALDPAPGATFEKGLWMLGFKQMKAARTLAYAGSALMRAKLFRDGPRMAVAEDLLWLKMQASKPIPYQVDGDYAGELTEAEIRWEPNKIEVIC